MASLPLVAAADLHRISGEAVVVKLLSSQCLSLHLLVVEAAVVSELGSATRTQPRRYLKLVKHLSPNWWLRHTALLATLLAPITCLIRSRCVKLVHPQVQVGVEHGMCEEEDGVIDLSNETESFTHVLSCQ